MELSAPLLLDWGMIGFSAGAGLTMGCTIPAQFDGFYKELH
jgi:hypothetical protein